VNESGTSNRYGSDAGTEIGGLNFSLVINVSLCSLRPFPSLLDIDVRF